MLELRCVSLKEANAFVEQHHRHHGRATGHKFSIGLYNGDRLIGVSIVGRPTGRYLDDGHSTAHSKSQGYVQTGQKTLVLCCMGPVQGRPARRVTPKYSPLFCSQSLGQALELQVGILRQEKQVNQNGIPRDMQRSPSNSLCFPRENRPLSTNSAGQKYWRKKGVNND